MKILLAGPGTGKTTMVKNIISESEDSKRYLVISFTNATVNDLQEELKDYGINEKNCMTLHKFALKYNHNQSLHILNMDEEKIIKQIEKGTNINFDQLCSFLESTTFDQMIDNFVSFSESNPLYISEIIQEFDTLIVDEYQDFNPTEQKLIDVLIKNISDSYILGDDDQCIYDFKDASSEKIISFYNDDTNNKIEHANICYRCPDKVVEAASNLIQNNKNRIQKEWIKSNKGGELIFEQKQKLDEVANYIIDNINLDKDTLILAPVRFIADAIINKFNQQEIEFTNYFFDKTQSELIAKSWILKAIYGKFQFTNLVFYSYKTLTNRKKFYITLKEQFNTGANYQQLLGVLGDKGEFFQSNELTLEDILTQDDFIDLKPYYECADGDSQEEKLENLFRNDNIKEQNNIKIMSIHKSKGLGAADVFIVGLNEGILPNATKGNDSTESQRRLFFVGMTRAKERLFLLSHIENEGKDINTVDKSKFIYRYIKRKYYGKTSSFINELKIL